jgi:MFS family permease
MHHAERTSALPGAALLRSLQHRDFRLLWIGILFMGAGQWIQQVTLGWLLYSMTGSSLLLGALNGVRTVPFLIAGPFAGVAADRFDRRKLLVMTQGLLVGATLVMGTLVAAGRAEPWHLFAFTLVSGIGWAFNQPLRQSLVPALVPRDDLMNAVALSSAGFNLTKIVGPAIGGLLIAWFGPGGNFFVQASAYGLVMITLLQISAQPPRDSFTHGSVFVDLRDGLRYVRRNPTVRALLFASLVMNVLAVPYLALMPVFQQDVLHVGAEGLGLLLGAPGVGAVVATLILAGLSGKPRRRGRLLLIGLSLLGASLILFAAAPSFPLALAALVLVGATQIWCLTSSMTLLHLLVPDELRGRVMSLAMLDRGLVPLGSLFAGALAQRFGAPLTVQLMGAAVIVFAAVAAWQGPELRSTLL